MKRWPTKLLGELCDVEGGNAAPQGDENFKDGTIPFVRMKDLGRYHFTNSLTETADKLTKDSAIANRMKLFEPGCILFPRSGSVALNHRAILGIRACIVSHIGVLQNLRPEISPGFLYLYLTTFDMTSLSKKTTGVDSIAFHDVKKIPVPVPPLAEQERIVKLLDDADELRKLRAQADRRAATLIPSLFHEMFGDPATNSKAWPVRPAGELMEACDYGTSQKANEEGRGVPVLRMGNVTTEGQLGLEDLKTVELAENELAKQRLQAGDVLFNRTNSRELVGKTGMWDGRFEAVAASYFIRVRFRADVEHPQHFTTFMNLPFMKRRLAQMARGAVGQANINSKELKSIPVPVPPLPLQSEFAQRVAEIRELEAAQATSRTRLDALFQSMLHHAFNEEL
jgi:type I restriction enzyme S subunit